ncbi:hypothetical protein GCM10009759_45330 [Kitasatospora saccharophila]|uniref:Thioesterase TesA-like domain-containing protein n=1 Tax=Kitasatospora saccharophila TaxID=407973 RepID=A0ABN2XA47_9ACTN
MAVHAPSTAEAPDRREAPRPAAQLVPLSPGAADGLPTLFLVHAIGGTVHPYAALAKALKDTYSVVGIEAFGLYGEGAPVDSLAEIVERYAAAVRAASPDGPYLLGGWSMGGIVAFEMARRLERDGAEVRFVAVLDSPFLLSPAELGLDGAAAAHDGASPLVARFAEDIADSLGWSIPAAAASDPLGWVAGAVTGDGDSPGDREQTQAMRAELEGRFRVFRAHADALAHYTPRGSVAADLLLLTPDRSSNIGSARRWATRTAGRHHHIHVPGDHYAFLRAPLVEEIASFIRTATAPRGALAPQAG